MKYSKIMWDMPISIDIETDVNVDKVAENIFTYFSHIDDVFSTYRATSETSKVNRGEIALRDMSLEMKEVFALCEKTKKETHGYFEYTKNGYYDPLGIVKGWAVQKAAEQLLKLGFKNFYIDAGGDVAVYGTKLDGALWSVGVKNPFNQKEIVKTFTLKDAGIATSGTYIRGQHIHDPYNPTRQITDIVSLTIIGPTVLEADRFATAAFAMGARGIEFIERLEGFEGYEILSNGKAISTSGLSSYI